MKQKLEKLWFERGLIMDDFEISTPVYLVDGILESGKTSFLNPFVRIIFRWMEPPF